MKNRTLMKKAKEAILKQIEELGEITIEEAIQLVDPHYSFDSQQARKSAVRRKAISIISLVKDEKGIRKNFVITDKEGTAKVIDIDKSKNVRDLDELKKHLVKSRITIGRSIKKIGKRQKQLTGQISIFDN